jgi:hypothetical protein
VDRENRSNLPDFRWVQTGTEYQRTGSILSGPFSILSDQITFMFRFPADGGEPRIISDDNPSHLSGPFSLFYERITFGDFRSCQTMDTDSRKQLNTLDDIYYMFRNRVETNLPV